MFEIFYIDYQKPIYVNGQCQGHEYSKLEIEAMNIEEATVRAKSMGYDVK